MGLANGDGLDVRGEAVEDAEEPGRDLAVALHAHQEEDRLRAEPEGPRHGHGGAHAPAAGLVGAGGDHAAGCGFPAHDDGLSPELGTVVLLDGAGEGVQVAVDDVVAGQRGITSGPDGRSGAAPPGWRRAGARRGPARAREKVGSRRRRLRPARALP